MREREREREEAGSERNSIWFITAPDSEVSLVPLQEGLGGREVSVGACQVQRRASLVVPGVDQLPSPAKTNNDNHRTHKGMENVDSIRWGEWGEDVTQEHFAETRKNTRDGPPLSKQHKST